MFLIIVFLLYGYFQSLSLALQVLPEYPLALVGGLILTWLLINNISIATLVGFIAVGGIAARNGIMMISHYLHLMKHEGETFSRKMVERGTRADGAGPDDRALAAGTALIPFVLAGDQPGKEIPHPRRRRYRGRTSFPRRSSTSSSRPSSFSTSPEKPLPGAGPQRGRRPVTQNQQTPHEKTPANHHCRRPRDGPSRPLPTRRKPAPTEATSTNVKPHAEFLVMEDRKVKITFIGADGKAVPPAGSGG